MKNIKHTELTDEALLQRYRMEKDVNLLGSLLQRYTLLLFGVAMKYLKDKDEAQDAVQQVFEKALLHLPQENIQNFKGWLYVLMRNHCLQLLRDTQHKTDEMILANIPAGTDDKESLVWKDKTLEQMKQAMALLDEAQRNAIVMFYLEEKSYKQIMEQTGYSFAQVKSYIQNGKRNLKQILMRQQ